MRLLSSVDPLPRPVLKVVDRKYEQEILNLKMLHIHKLLGEMELIIFYGYCS